MGTGAALWGPLARAVRETIAVMTPPTPIELRAALGSARAYIEKILTEPVQHPERLSVGIAYGSLKRAVNLLKGIDTVAPNATPRRLDLGKPPGPALKGRLAAQALKRWRS